MAIDDRTRAELEQALGRRLHRRDFLRIAALGGTAGRYGRHAGRVRSGCRVIGPRVSGSSAAAPSATTAASAPPASLPGAPSRSATSARRPVRCAASARPTTSSSTASSRSHRGRHPDRRSPAPDRDRRQGQPVQTRTAPRRSPASSSPTGIDLMLVASTPETDEPGGRPVRGQRRPLHLVGRALAAVLLRPPGRDPGQPEAVRLDLPLLLGPRGRHRGLPRHVGPGRHQQDRRRPVPQRRRRQRLGRRDERLPDAAQGGRLHADRSGPLREPARPTSSAQIAAFKKAGRRDPDRRPASRRTSRTSGRRPRSRASSPRSPRSARRCSSRRRSRRSARISAMGCRARSGGARATRSRRRSRRESAKALADGYTTDDREAVDPAHRLRPRPVRGRRRRPEADHQHRRQGRHPRCDQGDRPRHHRRTRRLGRHRPAAVRATNVAKTPLVGGQWGKGDRRSRTTS